MRTVDQFEQNNGFYLISSAQDLLNLSHNPELWDKNYLQIGDINMEGISDFSPIGNTSIPFTGTYDGQCYGIYNLHIDRPDGTYVALFGVNDGGKLFNIYLKSGKIHAVSVAAGICGDNAGVGIISKCYNGADVSVNVDVVGGIVGCVVADAQITDCENTGTIAGKSSVGGIAGYSSDNSVISSCCNMGKINVEKAYDVDEICGKSGGRIINCTSDHSIIEFDDIAFKKYIINNFDNDGDGEISVGEAKRIENVNFELWKSQKDDIKSIKGIEYFTFLKKLNCGNHQIDELDLSLNKELEDLKYFADNVKSINLFYKVTLGEEIRSTHWKRYYENAITFDEGGKKYVFCHSRTNNRWSISELSADWNLQSEIKRGVWARFYSSISKFEKDGRSYIFALCQEDNRWFVAELSSTWDGRSEMGNGHLDNYYGNVFVFEENGKVYLCGNSEEDKRAFIREILYEL